MLGLAAPRGPGRRLLGLGCRLRADQLAHQSTDRPGQTALLGRRRLAAGAFAAALDLADLAFTEPFGFTADFFETLTEAALLEVLAAGFAPRAGFEPPLVSFPATGLRPAFAAFPTLEDFATRRVSFRRPKLADHHNRLPTDLW